MFWIIYQSFCVDPLFQTFLNIKRTKRSNASNPIRFSDLTGPPGLWAELPVRCVATGDLQRRRNHRPPRGNRWDVLSLGGRGKNGGWNFVTKGHTFVDERYKCHKWDKSIEYVLGLPRLMEVCMHVCWFRVTKARRVWQWWQRSTCLARQPKRSWGAAIAIQRVKCDNGINHTTFKLFFKDIFEPPCVPTQIQPDSTADFTKSQSAQLPGWATATTSVSWPCWTTPPAPPVWPAPRPLVAAWRCRGGPSIAWWGPWRTTTSRFFWFGFSLKNEDFSIPKTEGFPPKTNKRRDKRWTFYTILIGFCGQHIRRNGRVEWMFFFILSRQGPFELLQRFFCLNLGMRCVSASMCSPNRRRWRTYHLTTGRNPRLLYKKDSLLNHWEWKAIPSTTW